MGERRVASLQPVPEAAAAEAAEAPWARDLISASDAASLQTRLVEAVRAATSQDYHCVRNAA